jgi:DNA-directed RNA polymerase specialized sigma24 family protein
VWDVRGTQPDRARLGAAVNYEQVFRDAAPGLWRTIHGFAAGRRAVADDAVAEAFARALEHAGQIRDPVPWLYRTAFRLAAEDLRRERREPELELELEPDQAAASAAGLAALVPALRQLSPAERAAGRPALRGRPAGPGGGPQDGDVGRGREGASVPGEASAARIAGG